MGKVTPASAVIDTNLLIYYINGSLDKTTKTFIEQSILCESGISIITRIEILGWQGHDGDSLLKTQALLTQLVEFPLDKAIAEQCIQLRQQYKIKLPDAIIAATALHLKRPLFTRNILDFAFVKGLMLYNPLQT